MRQVALLYRFGLLDAKKPLHEDNLAILSSSFDHSIIMWAKQRNIWMHINR